VGLRLRAGILSSDPLTALDDMHGTYDLGLVIASYLVAVIASFASLDLAARLPQFEQRPHRFWLGIGALTMGTGIWTTHFVGMQALHLPVAMSYDLWLTALSWSAGVASSLMALYIMSRRQLQPPTLILGAILMGAGICAMHYVGMDAMRMDPPIHYDPFLLWASVAIAVGASAGALYLAFSVRQVEERLVLPAKLAAALVMGGAICGMHYTGMAAAEFPPAAQCGASNLLRGSWIGLPVALAVIGFTVLILVSSERDARQLHRRRELAAERLTIQRTLHRSLNDDQSGLPNRDTLERALSHDLALDADASRPVAVLQLRLLTPPAPSSRCPSCPGEQALMEIGFHLRRIIGKHDLLSRTPASGYTVLLRPRLNDPELSPEIVLARLLARLGKRDELSQRPPIPPLAVGWAVAGIDGQRVDDLMRAATSPRQQLDIDRVEDALS
jgi:MHYT domain (predicted integral membrane sensor domain)